MVMGVPEGDAIYAFDAATGRARWSFHTAGQDMASPALYRGTLIFANGDFHAYALDAMTGRLLWKRDLPGMATMASAATADGRVFVSTCDYRFPYHCATEALDPVNGKLLWKAPYGDADSSPTYANGTVFVSGLDYLSAKNTWPLLQQAYGVVAALDASTGKPKWVYRDGTPQIPSDVGTAERAVAGTYAAGKYFQSLPGSSEFLAFDARTGNILWRFHSLAPIKMSPLYYRNRIYAGGNAGVLYVLNASTGGLAQIRTFRQPFTAAPPMLVGDTLLLAQNRSVRAISLQHLSGNATMAPVVEGKVQRWTQ
jgi:outer membrane protein assembly factor BamB